MTDNYGNDPHNEHSGEHVHDEQLGAEGEAGEHEVWHDEHPPVDDFADQPAEEIATVSEETEMHEDHDEPEVMRRKTSVLLPIAAGIGGLLFLGALLYWQFGGMFKQQAAAPIPPLRAQSAPIIPETPAITASTPATAGMPPVPAIAVAPTTSLAAITDATTSTPATASATTGLQNGTATPNAGPAPVVTPVVAPAVPPSPPVAVTASAMPTPAAVPVVAAPVAPKVSSAATPKTSAAVIPAAPAVVTPVAATPAAPASTPVKDTAKDAAIDARLNALTTSVEGLQKSLASATQQLSQVSNMIAANPPNAGVEDRLNKIEQQLSQRQTSSTTTTSVSESPAMLSDSVSAKTTVVHHTHKAKAPSVTVMPQDSESVATATHRSSRRHATTSVSAKSKTPHWILRAATPTEAWVSTDPFSPDLHHVQIGDTLPGIGKITAIHQRGDSWMVVGSKGTLK
jgi:intracellular multiplication protein IcmG